MATAREELPAGRYGRDADRRADRRLRQVGTVLGVLAALALGWFGWHYVAGSEVSGQLIKSKIVSDVEAQAHIEVHKDPGATVVCTLRSLAESGSEVGLRDVTVDRRESRVDTVVSIRTTSRGTAVELLDCRVV